MNAVDEHNPFNGWFSLAFSGALTAVQLVAKLCIWIDYTSAQQRAEERRMAESQQKAQLVVINKDNPPDMGASGVVLKPKTGPVISPAAADFPKHEILPDRYAVSERFQAFDRYTPDLKWKTESFKITT